MLIEIAVGDAYGAGFEYADADFVAAHNTLQGYVQHPTHTGVRPGTYTDDTQMTIAVAELLISGRPWTAQELADQFVRSFKRDPREGYARRFHALLSDVGDGEELLTRLDPRSDRSGAAMRAGPVGLLPTVSDVLHYAGVQARVTHDTPAGVEAAQAAALAVHFCHYELGPRSHVGRWIDEHLLAAGGAGGWSEPWRGPVGANGTMSVRAALTAVVAGASLSEVLRRCVAFTGDVDTVATIALAAASRSAATERDLPKPLQRNLEDGPYGRGYLRELDQQLLSWASPPVGSVHGDVLDHAIHGLWSTLPLYLGAMEANDVAFLADGTGWFGWSNALVDCEARRFTWQVVAPGDLRVHLSDYIHRVRGAPAKIERRSAAKPNRWTARVGRGTDALDNDVTVLTLGDESGRPARRYALIRSDVRRSDDPLA